MPSEIGTLYYNLAHLIEAGVPVVRSVKTVSAGLKGKYRRAIEQMAVDISAGKTIAESMAKYPRLFSQLDIMTIHACDTAGRIEDAFKKLAQWHEFQYRMDKKLLNGMVLPIILIHLAALFGPFPAYILGSRSIKEYLTSAISILLLLYIPVLIVILIRNLMPERGLIKKLFDVIILRIPLLGSAIEALNIARFTRAFSLLASAAVPPAQAVEKAVSTTKNAVVASLFAPMAASARNGNPLSEGLLPGKPDNYYYNCWLIGEETGDLDKVTNRLSTTYIEKAEELFTYFCTWLPRLVYVYVSIIIIIQIFKGLAQIYGSTRYTGI